MEKQKMESSMGDFEKASNITVKALDRDLSLVQIDGRKYHVSIGNIYAPMDIDSDEPYDFEKGFLGIGIDKSSISNAGGHSVSSVKERQEVADKVAEYFRSQGFRVEIS